MSELSWTCAECGQACSDSRFHSACVTLFVGLSDTRQIQLPGEYCSLACAKKVEAVASKAINAELERAFEQGEKFTADALGSARLKQVALQALTDA